MSYSIYTNTIVNIQLLWCKYLPKLLSYSVCFVQLVKDIRRLVDNGEFLANRHCGSPVVKLIATLILELVTDHSREVNTLYP